MKPTRFKRRQWMFQRWTRAAAALAAILFLLAGPPVPEAAAQAPKAGKSRISFMIWDQTCSAWSWNTRDFLNAGSIL